MTSFSAKMSSTTVSSKMEADSPPPSLEAGTEDEVESRDEEDESSRSEETLPTFQGQSKLGFSIAQIMGFMGNNSGGIGGGSTKSQSVEDKEIKTKEEDMKRPQQTHFEMASNHGANTVAAEHSQQQPLPLMPKLWRPQPFRDYGISHSSQPKYVMVLFSEKLWSHK